MVACRTPAQVGREVLDPDIEAALRAGSGWGPRRRRFGLEFELAGRTRENVRLAVFERLQLAGGIFEFLVFDELADQFPPWILPLLFPFQLGPLLDRQ